eukprot:9999696-Ditylum_brightwellii.AAC.1
MRASKYAMILDTDADEEEGQHGRRRVMAVGTVTYQSIICRDVFAKFISQGPDGIGTWINQIWGALIKLYHYSMVLMFCTKVLRKKGSVFWKNDRDKDFGQANFGQVI